MITKELMHKFEKFIRSLPLDFTNRPNEFGYRNPVLILADATLSINRNYRNFVVPRIKLLERSNVSSFEGLIIKIRKIGTDNFCKLWSYNHKTRVELLYNLATKFMAIRRDLKSKNDLDTLRQWGKITKAEDYKNFKVPGIGFTTFQYLRMMCGANTVKPDVHISKAILLGTGNRLSAVNKVNLVEQVAASMKMQAQDLDYALWHFYSNKK